MVRLFLFALLLALGYGLLRLFLRQLQQGPRRPSAPKTSPGEELVRDPVCGQYVAASTAVVAEVGGERRHFCSTACRDAYRGQS
jgi:uncharacterized protein